MPGKINPNRHLFFEADQVSDEEKLLRNAYDSAKKNGGLIELTKQLREEKNEKLKTDEIINLFDNLKEDWKSVKKANGHVTYKNEVTKITVRFVSHREDQTISPHEKKALLELVQKHLNILFNDIFKPDGGNNWKESPDYVEALKNFYDLNNKNKDEAKVDGGGQMRMLKKIVSAPETRPPRIVVQPDIRGTVDKATISVGNANNVPPNQIEAVRLYHEELLQQGIGVGAHFTGGRANNCQLDVLNVESTVQQPSVGVHSASLHTTWCFSGEENGLGTLSIHIGNNLRQEDFARLRLPTHTLLLKERELKPAAHQKHYSQLSRFLTPVKQNTVGNHVILYGAPGLGKSYCAQHYLYYAAPERHHMVVWLSGTSSAAFQRNWHALAESFRWMDSDLKEEPDDSVVIHTWCEQKLGKWLLVIDDVNIAAEELEPYLPRKGGHVLLTTRHPDYSLSHAEKLHFLPLDLQDSQSLVQVYFGRYWSNIGHAPEEAEAFKQLLNVMGGYPVALAQAALLICKKSLSFSRFMMQFQDATTRAYLLQDTVFGELRAPQTVAHCWANVQKQLLTALQEVLPEITADEMEKDLNAFIVALIKSAEACDFSSHQIHTVKTDELIQEELITISFQQQAQLLTAYQTYLPAYLPVKFDAAENAWQLTGMGLTVLQRLAGITLTPSVNPTASEGKLAAEELNESKTNDSIPTLTLQTRATRPIAINFSLRDSSQVGDIGITVQTENYQQREVNLKSGWKLPRPNLNFIPRERLTQELAEKLPVESKEEATQQILLTTAVTGMGGVGKTELARHFITQHPQSQQYSYRFWLDASTPAQLYSEYRALALYLHLIEAKPYVEDEEMLKRLKKWLSINKGWLLVLDNADEYNNIKVLIPEVGGCVVVTTRDSRPSTFPQERVVAVPILVPEEAFSWLCQLARRPAETLAETERVAAHQLLEKLGYLPLAIAQAGAYLYAHPGVTIERYLAQFATLLSDKTLAQEAAVEGEAVEVTQARFVVSSTWHISLQEIKKNLAYPELVDELLGACAYLAAKNIPLSVLELFFQKAWGDRTQEPLLHYQLDEYLGQLLRYSLVDRDSRTDTLSLHNLLQEVVRLQQSSAEQQAHISEAMQYLTICNPGEGGKPEAEQRWQAFMPHLEATIRHYYQQGLEENTNLASALFQLASLYGNCGNTHKERDLLERALAIQEAHYGPSHYQVAITLRSLGDAHGALGDAHKHRDLLERALAIQEAHYGPSHYQVAITLRSLGDAHGALGDAHKHRDLLERALAIQEAHYGPNHYQAAITLRSLGDAHGALGDAHKHRDLLERALAIQEAHYGPNHYQVAITLRSLGDAYGALGSVRKHRDLLERALAIQEAHYGPNHYQVAITLRSLGDAYGALGSVHKHRDLLERALPILEAHYGSNHYQAAITLRSLGDTYGALGDAHKNRDLLERALPILEAHYGSNHYQAAVTLRSLGDTYGALGDAHKNRDLLERALPILETHYGPNHYQVAGTLGNLGVAYGALGDTHKQRDLLERALAIQEAHYGPNHYRVAVTSGNLGIAYGSLGDAHKQRDLLERALSILEAHYGPHHYRVAATLGNLGIAYGSLGDAHKQRDLLERALSILEAHYGPDHYRVAGTLENLGIACGELGDTLKKQNLLERALSILEAHYGPDHYRVASTLENLGIACGELGDTLKKQNLLERALSILEAHYGPPHYRVAATLGNLGIAYGSLGDAHKQRDLLERALSILEAHYGPDHYRVAGTLENLGIACGELGDTLKKQNLLERALSILEAHYGPNHQVLAITLTNLAVTYHQLGQYKAALQAAQRVYRILIEHRGYVVNPLQTRRYINALQSVCRFTLKDLQDRVGSPGEKKMERSPANIESGLTYWSNKSALARLQQEAHQNLTNKDYKNALLSYRQLIGIYERELDRHTLNNRAIAYYGLGYAYLQLKQLDKALLNLQKAVVLNPNKKLYVKKLAECEEAIKTTQNDNVPLVSPPDLLPSTTPDANSLLPQQSLDDEAELAVATTFPLSPASQNERNENRQLINMVPIRIINGGEGVEVRSPILVPPGMRIAGWEPLKYGEEKTSGSVTLNILVHEVEQQREERVLVDEEDLKVGLKVDVPGFPGEVVFNEHLKKKLDDLFKNNYGKYTLELVATVKPLNKGVFRKSEKVNLDVTLPVYFEPIPELANENQGNDVKVNKIQQYAIRNVPTIESMVREVHSNVANVRNAPPHLAEKVIAHQSNLVTRGIENMPVLGEGSKVGTLTASVVDLNFSSTAQSHTFFPTPNISPAEPPNLSSSIQSGVVEIPILSAEKKEELKMRIPTPTHSPTLFQPPPQTQEIPLCEEYAQKGLLKFKSAFDRKELRELLEYLEKKHEIKFLGDLQENGEIEFEEKLNFANAYDKYKDEKPTPPIVITKKMRSDRVNIDGEIVNYEYSSFDCCVKNIHPENPSKDSPSSWSCTVM